MKRLVIAAALALSTCAPAHANIYADAMANTCKMLTQVAINYQNDGVPRSTLNQAVDHHLKDDFTNRIMHEMLDMIDQSESGDLMTELAVNRHCLEAQAEKLAALK